MRLRPRCLARYRAQSAVWISCPSCGPGPGRAVAAPMLTVTQAPSERLQLPREHAGQLCVTVSIGAATVLPGAGTTLSQLIHTADSALYRAKHLGRNRISLPETTLT